MRRPRQADVLHAAHQELRRDRVIEIDLDSSGPLTGEDGFDPSCVDHLVETLDSALRLPETLVVRVRLPEGRDIDEQAVSAFHAYCRDRAGETWREAIGLRNGGIRELPRALVLSVTAAAVGVVSGTLAQSIDQTVLMVLLYAVAFVAVIAAWTIGWTPIEQATFDWRMPAHTAASYELLSTARVEAAPRPSLPETAPTAMSESR